MNRREADTLRQVLELLERGPGNGWRELLEDGAGLEPGRDGKGIELRLADFDLWRSVWIFPTLRAIVDRYWRPSRTARELAPPVPSTRVARLRQTLREGEERHGRGGEDPPYWIGFFHSIARQALEELERREGRS